MFAHVIGPALDLEFDAFAREIRQCRQRDQPIAICPSLAGESAQQRRGAELFVFDTREADDHHAVKLHLKATFGKREAVDFWTQRVPQMSRAVEAVSLPESGTTGRRRGNLPASSPGWR